MNINFKFLSNRNYVKQLVELNKKFQAINHFKSAIHFGKNKDLMIVGKFLDYFLNAKTVKKIFL